MAVTLSCVSDIRNFFTRSQHYLDKEFGVIEGVRGVWEGKIRNGGNFPVGSGGAARTTLLGFERPRVTTIRWNPKVGLQDDCRVSCDTPANLVRLGNADHKWYRLTDYAENTEVFCLKSMWLDALNLPAQIRNIVTNLKNRTTEIMDDWYRTNQVAISANRWVGVDDGTNNPRVIRNVGSAPAWRFEQDADGNVNVNKIILSSDIEPGNIGLLSIDTLNYIRQTGSYTGAFPVQGQTPIITDWETADYMPKMDTNVRMDNRYRSPEALDPAFGAVSRYANYDFTFDPFTLRYYWDTEDPNYPNGVLTRIDQWTSAQVSEGCWDVVSEDYLNADFQITIPFNNMVYEMQNAQYDAPPEMPFEQPQSPYTGLWRFVNEVNEVTPCNVDRTKAFWRMLFEKAAKPDRYDLGHVILHRRFNTRGVFRSCRTLQVPVGGYYYCNTSCAPLDHYPPALVTRSTCGKWNQSGLACNG